MSDALTTLTIDLDAVAFNYLFMKNRLTNGADCAAVVKADAYGLGAAAIAAELFSQGCRHFFVARVDEGFTVQKALPPTGTPGNDTAVYVLDGPRGFDMDAIAASGLIPVLNTRADITDWAALSDRLGRRLSGLIHIDTGMNRLGLNAAEVEWLAGEGAANLDAIDVRYVMSHLACADTPADEMNTAQLTRLQQALTKIGRAFRVSFANSAGVLLGSGYHFDLARPGCALYGINPLSTGQRNPMQPVVTLKTRIMQVNDVTPSETVGYGASFKAETPRKTATLAMGYADGFLRVLQRSGGVYIQGQFCPVTGRVSMDTVVVDVTDLPKQVEIGDWAEVIGKQQRVDDLARLQGTIGYEILTGIGTRIKRTYIKTSEA